MKQIENAEYERLKRDSLKLQALEEGGVDNWDWYGDAIERYEELCTEAGLESED